MLSDLDAMKCNYTCRFIRQVADSTTYYGMVPLIAAVRANIFALVTYFSRQLIVTFT